METRAQLRPYEDRGSLNGSTIAEHHTPQLIVFDDQLSNLTLNDADAARFEFLAFRVGEVVRVREEDQVIRPLTDELCVLDRAGAQGVV